MIKNVMITISVLGFIILNVNANERRLIDEKTKKEIISVLEVNESLFNSFFNYDGKKMEKSALQLRDAMAKISNPEITKLLGFSIKKLNEMKADSSREDNNQAYHLVSMALIHIVATYDVGDVYNAYSCPMVKKKWLQNSKKMEKIHNPYAPGMPNCGSQDSKY